MTKQFFVFAVGLSATFGQTPSGSGTRMTPPTIRDVSPRGIARGTSVELSVEGFNLSKASKIFFNQPGVTGKILRVKELPDLSDVRLGSNGTVSTIDLGPLPQRNQVTVELEISPDAEIGEVAFRLQTPQGTSPEGTILVEPYYGESPDKEPNDTLEGAFEVFLPSILAGAISKPGDVDHFKLKVKAGQTLVFENSAMRVGSTLQPVIAILDMDGKAIGEYGYDGGRTATQFAHTFKQDGTYYVRISDYERSGRAGNTYRFKVGEFGLATSTFPLGLRRGATADIAIAGHHLNGKLQNVKGEPTVRGEDTVNLRPVSDDGHAFNEVKLALGDDPEVLASEKNISAATSQKVDWPATVNGVIRTNGIPGHFYRFTAKKGQQFVIDVNAKRLGSELDSEVEVLDAQGKPIELAVVRPILETNMVLRDHDSASPGIRIQSWTGMAVGDYMLAGRELLRIEALPRGPDDDMRFENFGGQRVTFLNTSSEAHSIDKAIYKVQIHPAGKQFTSNGLPLTRLYYKNDDGGSAYGKDSRVDFTAPADGEYIVRINDVRGQGGPDYGYRLAIREPRPDYRLAVNPRNPNVPAGGVIPLTVTATRMDGFDGPIDLEIVGLPKGLKATKGTVGAGQATATLLLSADAEATLESAAQLTISGKAQAAGKQLVRFANGDDLLKLISISEKPDVIMVAQTSEVTLQPGGTAEIKVKITRQNGFGGRVPVQVMNLPPRVRVLDVGLNGVLLNEDETERSFTLEALDSAEPVEQLIYVAGQVETRSTQQNLHAAWQPVLVKVKPKVTVSASR